MDIQHIASLKAWETSPDLTIQSSCPAQPQAFVMPRHAAMNARAFAPTSAAAMPLL